MSLLQANMPQDPQESINDACASTLGGGDTRLRSDNRWRASERRKRGAEHTSSIARFRMPPLISLPSGSTPSELEPGRLALGEKYPPMRLATSSLN